MASFEVEGLFDFDKLLNANALPNNVMNDMLKAAADVAVKAQKASAKAMLSGKYATGELAESITKSRVVNTRDGKYIRIIFKGSRKRGKTTTANAYIAYVNEYGSHKQNARPFIRTANEKCEEEAIDAAAKVYDDHLDSLGF